MEHFSTYITELFFSVSPIFRIIIIFLFSFAEGFPIVGTLVPGGTVAILVGTLSNEGFILPIYAIIILSLGSFLGDMSGFLISKKFKNWKWIKNIVESEKHQKKWDLFDRHLIIIIIFCKIIPIIRSTPSIFAGIRNVKVQKYAVLSFIGSLLWAVVGVYSGNLLSKIAGKIAIPIILGILVVSVVSTIVLNLNKSKK
jgi:membrane protein DedA with SNARE-associated domain